jgi:thymidylate synthase
MVLGFPADVAGFALLQCILAEHLGVAPGIYTHTISNAHIYDNHYAGAQEMVTRPNSHAPIRITIPKDTFTRAEKKDHTLAAELIAEFDKQYTPQAAIGGLKIAL